MEIRFDPNKDEDWDLVCTLCKARKQASSMTQATLDKPKCSKCGKIMTDGETSYCRSNAKELDGVLSCFKCRSAVN